MQEAIVPKVAPSAIVSSGLPKWYELRHSGGAIEHRYTLVHKLLCIHINREPHGNYTGTLLPSDLPPLLPSRDPTIEDDGNSTRKHSLPILSCSSETGGVARRLALTPTVYSTQLAFHQFCATHHLSPHGHRGFLHTTVFKSLGRAVVEGYAAAAGDASGTLIAALAAAKAFELACNLQERPLADTLASFAAEPVFMVAGLCCS
jgi:hypothetical protein